MRNVAGVNCRRYVKSSSLYFVQLRIAFLDPHLVAGGYLGVAGYIVGIAVVITAVAAGVVRIGRRRSRGDGSEHTGRSGVTDHSGRSEVRP